MTTQAMVLAEAELDAAPVGGSEESGRYRLTVPLCLAAGWGALIAFSVMFLMDEAKVGTASAAQDRTIVAEAPIFDAASEELRPIGAAARGPRWDEPEVAAPPTVKPAATVKTVALTGEPPAASPRADVPPIERIDYAGTWGPTTAACGAKSRRRGYIPAVLTAEGAKAGRTLCHFRNGRRDGIAWAVAADCSERGRRWTSQVRLLVDGDRLTWTSAKGSSFYVRCGRRDG